MADDKANMNEWQIQPNLEFFVFNSLKIHIFPQILLSILKFQLQFAKEN